LNTLLSMYEISEDRKLYACHSNGVYGSKPAIFSEFDLERGTEIN